MPNFDYTVPVVSTPESNNSLITKKTVVLMNCTWQINDGCTGWNFNHCPNDDDYCQPFLSDDKMFLQYLLPVTWSGFGAVEMISNGESIDFGTAIQVQIGKDSNGLRYANLLIDASLLPDGVTCFHIKITFWDCPELVRPSQAFITCVQTQVGLGDTLAEAVIHCGNQFCDEENQKIVYSEPFCLVRCEEPTLLIEGVYPKYDCSDFYYGDLLNLNTLAVIASIYELKFRIRGFLELDGYETTETQVNGVTTKIKQVKKYTLYSDKIPPYVADQIARAAASKTFIVDGIEYDRPATITKEFDQGLSWIPKLVLTKECSELDLTCE